MAGPREINTQLIASLPDQGPVVMVNMLRLRDRAAYKRYSELTMPLIKARGGTVIAVGHQGDEELAGRADHCLGVPAAGDLVMPFLTVVPLQLLAYHIAVRRGCDVDQPRNLAKSVTVE